MTSFHPLASRSTKRGPALVTGGTSGIGLAFARQLGAAGYPLVLVARGQERLEAVRAQFLANGVPCEVIRADLGVDDDVARLCDWMASQQPPIEVFVNNAGSGLYHPIVTDDFEEIENALSLMGRAPVKLGGVAAQVMREASHGRIINISSVQGFVPMGMYAAIKAFIRLWSESLAQELHGTGVSVTAVLPGWVRSGFHANSGGRRSGVPDFLWLDPEQVAKAALRAAERGKTRCIPTARYKVIGFLAEKGPRAAVNAVARALRSSKGASGASRAAAESGGEK
ncbi:SDR family oxidoreductase [Actinobaculum massiliense]|uniref:SDR family NAD(P)-dependent oxidoreductase n=1 Tax=Actinobaculum massiliense TaxID=202789 RepID=UPI001E2C1729|nr:SDR family NAD(P)-dependent oxidoreductase [Actinobaculum massiliense]MDK8318539.1 SDR family NAD(P)-dependent oxidoreductase [Actinobaculum massiliense]MDK8566963.1 SDR family NAD(P)-dependent oxidoreductase [Actinobaculum massiliense]